MKYFLIFVLNLWTFFKLASSQHNNISIPVEQQPCSSNIFCYGQILHTIQLSRLYKDSKTFVDKSLKFSNEKIWSDFTLMMTKYENEPPREIIRNFVDENFHPSESLFENWIPEDWTENPEFVQNLTSNELREFALEIHGKWKDLGRKIKNKVKDNGGNYSIIYVDNASIVPGGRFSEFYYWDSYWTIKGLLLSEMYETIRGILENFMEMVQKFGYVPNGGRIYFQRSQPPLLIPMVKLYYESTQNLTFIRQHIHTMVQEFNFWRNPHNKRIVENIRGYHSLLRYNVELDGPRPESYREDFELGQTFINSEEKRELYYNLKTCAESGFDFSSRWFVPENETEAEDGHLFDTKTRDFIPVDLNSFYYRNAVILADFFKLLKDIKNERFYRDLAARWKLAIEEVLWDPTEGSWFDYHIPSGKLKKNFYPSNLSPLYNGIELDFVDIRKLKDYLKKNRVLEFEAGVPTSLINSGQQWDLPNAWAPLQDIMVNALENTGDPECQEMALNIAQKWVMTTFKTFYDPKYNKTMFEKYDVTQIGNPGAGGEYQNQEGFGWTNSVVLNFIHKYGNRFNFAKSSAHLSHYTCSTTSNIIVMGFSITFIFISGLI